MNIVKSVSKIIPDPPDQIVLDILIFRGILKLHLNTSGSYLSDNLGNRSGLSRALKITPITIPGEAKEIIHVTYERVPSNASRVTIVLDYGGSWWPGSL